MCLLVSEVAEPEQGKSFRGDDVKTTETIAKKKQSMQNAVIPTLLSVGIAESVYTFCVTVFCLLTTQRRRQRGGGQGGRPPCRKIGPLMGDCMA